MLSALGWATWYAGWIFAFGFVGSYLVLTRTLELLPTWVTLGGTGAMALAVASYTVWDELR